MRQLQGDRRRFRRPHLFAAFPLEIIRKKELTRTSAGPGGRGSPRLPTKIAPPHPGPRRPIRGGGGTPGGSLPNPPRTRNATVPPFSPGPKGVPPTPYRSHPGAHLQDERISRHLFPKHPPTNGFSETEDELPFRTETGCSLWWKRVQMPKEGVHLRNTRGELPPPPVIGPGRERVQPDQNGVGVIHPEVDVVPFHGILSGMFEFG